MRKLLSNLSISRKLLIAPGIAILFLVMCGAISWLGLVQQKSAIKDIYENRFKGYENQALTLLELSGIHTNLHKVVTMVQAKYDTAKVEAFAAKQTTAMDRVGKAIADRLSLKSIGPDERGELERARSSLAEYAKMARDMTDMATTDVSIAITYMDSLDEKYAVLYGEVNKLLKLQTDLGERGYERALSSFNKTMSVALTVVALAVVLSFMASLFMSRTITGPITTVISLVNEIGKGNLAVRVEAAGRDETGQLLVALKNMSEKMRTIISGVKDASDRMSSASQRLSAGSLQASQGAKDQAGKASTAAAAATEMSQTIVNVARNVSAIEASATGTTDTAKEGERIVRHSVEEVREIADTVSETSRLIVSLGERSNQITEIVTVIREIADQTNLLALNAAIEAARAGEQGRGFAVVADEVKKLAERTAKSTEEISSTTGFIQGELSKVIESMENVKRKVESGVSYSSDAGDALKNIVQSVEGLSIMVREITSATGGMAAASNEISRDLELIATVASQTSMSSSETMAAADDLATLSTGLERAVGEFSI